MCSDTYVTERRQMCSSSVQLGKRRSLKSFFHNIYVHMFFDVVSL